MSKPAVISLKLRIHLVEGTPPRQAQAGAVQFVETEGESIGMHLGPTVAKARPRLRSGQVPLKLVGGKRGAS